MLISMLNCASSVWKSSSAISSSTCWFANAGSPVSSVRLSSISSPIERRSGSNRASASMRAKTSRHCLTLSRYRCRSSRVNCVSATSSPMGRPPAVQSVRKRGIPAPMSLTDRDLELRHRIFMEFAANGAQGEHGNLSSLAEHHVVVLDDDGQIVMAHPFAAHHDGARVQSDGREWWGNCAWDAFGIVAALNLEHATITA